MVIQIGAIAAVVILLTVGAGNIVKASKGKAELLWTAFVVYVASGLVLGWALAGVMRWALSLGGRGSALAIIVAVFAVWTGWHAVYLLVAMIRDVADKRPDEDARKAALWVPTLLPVGGQAVWSTVTNPTGGGAVTTVAAALMLGVTVLYVHRIVHASLQGKSNRKAWNWFAAAVCLLAGVISIPLVMYLDGVAARALPGDWLIALRILSGVLGAALGVAAVKDISDKVPDAAVRAFLRFGLPLVIVFGSVAIATMAGYATNGGEILIGGVPNSVPSGSPSGVPGGVR